MSSPRPSCSTTSGTPSEETAPNAVEVYIGYLRRKLGRDVLETVRGAGYRLASIASLDEVVAAPVAAGPADADRGHGTVRRAGLVGGLALVAALGFVLQRSVDAEAERTARDVAALVELRERCRSRCRWPGAHLVQVVDSQDRVRSASIDADRLVPMLHPDELAAGAGRGAALRGR